MLAVMEHLQKECDYQAKQIVDEFRKHRDLIRKIHIVTQYMNQKSETKIDPKELDIVLSELTLLNARTELYARFVKRRVTVWIDFRRSH
jgi:hypothetical protein